MIARSMIAGAMLLAVAAGCAPRATTRTGALLEAKGPFKVTQKQFTDDGGTTLTLQFDASTGEVVSATATDRQRAKVDVHEIKRSDVTVCVPRGAGAGQADPKLCQPLAFLTDGAFVKMGTATCTCYVYAGRLYCYGDTCR